MSQGKTGQTSLDKPPQPTLVDGCHCRRNCTVWATWRHARCATQYSMVCPDEYSTDGVTVAFPPVTVQAVQPHRCNSLPSEPSPGQGKHSGGALPQEGGASRLGPRTSSRPLTVTFRSAVAVQYSDTLFCQGGVLGVACTFRALMCTCGAVLTMVRWCTSHSLCFFHHYVAVQYLRLHVTGVTHCFL